jgi:hypothetical protein
VLAFTDNHFEARIPLPAVRMAVQNICEERMKRTRKEITVLNTEWLAFAKENHYLKPHLYLKEVISFQNHFLFNTVLIFSAYLKASAAKTITATLSATDDDGGDADTSVATWALTTAWTRYSVRLFVPIGFSTLGNITMALNLAATLTGEDVYIDNSQFEKGFIPTDYFDGSLPEAQGVFWSATAHASYSYAYISRTIKIPRLLWTLGEWMALNQPYRIRSYKGFEGNSYSRNA